MEPVLMSDNAEVVDALATWLEGVLPLETRPCAVLAHALLCRKELKIKRGAINQVLKSLNVGERFGEIREKLVTSGLLHKISGQNGSTVYAIDLDVAGIVLSEAPETSETPEVAEAPEVREEAGSPEDAAPVSAPEPEDASAPIEISADAVEPVADKQLPQPAGKRERAAAKKKPKEQQRASDKHAKRREAASVAPEEKKPQERAGVLGLLSAGRKIGLSVIRRDKAVDTKKAPAEKKGKKAAQPDDFERVRAWIAEYDGQQVPYVTRRQRAYQIFDDEKALEGKRGERLMRRLASKGINPGALRISSNQTPPLQGFFGIGADQPFIVVENIDAYEEIVSLLKTRRNVRLFGERVGGVIFGAGHNVCQAHALDEYLHNIGYRYDFVYYAGDIDREGARLVEKAREVNVIEIRLHTGMYRAMFEAHKAHVQRGSSCESAAKNQDCPRSLVGILKGLPWSLRVPFKRALRDNIRIPQEVLTSDDFRRGSLGNVDRFLDR